MALTKAGNRVLKYPYTAFATNRYEELTTASKSVFNIGFDIVDTALTVYIDGVRQQASAFSVTGAQQITLSTAVVTGTEVAVLAMNSDYTQNMAAKANQVIGAVSGDAQIYNGSLWVPSNPNRKNFLINGDMNIFQRGSNFVSAASGTYGVDRWAYMKTGACVHDVAPYAGVPTIAQAGRKIGYSLSLDCTTAMASPGASDYCMLRYRVEGNDARNLMGRTVTLSFWVKGTKTGIHSVGFRNSGSDYGYVAEYTINTTNTWEFKTITLQMTDGSTGTWDYTTGIGLQLSFMLSAGSSFRAAPGSWGASSLYASNNQVNATDSTANNFYLAGVQLELGSVATPFEFRPFAEELALCERYYQMSSQGLMGWAESTSRYHINTPFGTKMRTSPIPTILAPAATQLRQGATNSTPTGQSLVSHNSKATGSLVIIDVTGITLTANAAVVINSIGTYSFGFDAEL